MSPSTNISGHMWRIISPNHNQQTFIVWFKSRCMWEKPGEPCCIQAYTVYTTIGGKGRCHTSCELQDHSTQAGKSSGKISTLDLKPMRKDTQSPKQQQSVAPQNGPWSKQKMLHITQVLPVLKLMEHSCSVVFLPWTSIHPCYQSSCREQDLGHSNLMFWSIFH